MSTRTNDRNYTNQTSDASPSARVPSIGSDDHTVTSQLIGALPGGVAAARFDELFKVALIHLLERIEKNTNCLAYVLEMRL